jgi:pantetheine-phosphate adenylyltransferase
MNIAVYPGSFDPVTFGHLDIIQRGCHLFDKVIVVILINAAKKPLFTVAERTAMIQEVIPSLWPVEVDRFDGLLVDYVHRRKAKILRGLRNSADFEMEWQMAATNRQLQGIETFFLMGDGKYSFIRSTIVKEIARYGANVEKWVPNHVAKGLQRKFSSDVTTNDLQR